MLGMIFVSELCLALVLGIGSYKPHWQKLYEQRCNSMS